MTLPLFKRISSQETDKGMSIHQMDIDQKVMTIMRWMQSKGRIKPLTMLYLIMYDITDNKIRTHVAKYLISKGCMRIQKSVFLSRSTRSTYKEIHSTLREINEVYDNHDSILVLPVPEDKFNHLKMIGQNINFEVVLNKRNVLFF